MGLRSWIQRQLSGHQSRVDLVKPTGVVLTPPNRVGLEIAPVPAPWSVARLQALFEAMEQQPSQATDQAARLARHQLSKFWLAAPVDQLQHCYAGAIGDLQRLQLTGPLVQQELAKDEIRWRDQLLQRLEDPARAAERINLLLALMPYTKPRKLSVAEPLSTLPDWLLNDYCVYCEPNLAAPVGLLESAQDNEAEGSGSIEPMTDRRGEEAMIWFRDEAVVSRMHELIQAFGADPGSQSVLQELAGLRRVLAQLWLDVEPVQLQTLYNTAVGDVTQALIRAGFGAVVVDEADSKVRAQLGGMTLDFSQPKAPAGVLAVLLFHPLEAVELEGMNGLPDWLITALKQLN